MTNDETRTLDEVVHRGDIAMLATLDSSGRLTSRPMIVADVEKDALRFLVDVTADWVDDADSARQVNAAISATGRNDWVSVSGPSMVGRDPATVERLWSPAAGAYFDGKDDPTLGVLQLTVDRGEFWSAPGGGPIGRALALVGTALSGGDEVPGVKGDISKR